MRNLKFIFAWVLCLTLMYSFHDDESSRQETEQVFTEPNQRAMEVEKISQLIEDKREELVVLSKSLGEFETINFEVVKNLITGEITLENFTTDTFFPIASKQEYQQRAGDYQVDCDLPGDDNDWSESCGSKWSCGGLIADGLEAGGCATICNQKNNTIDRYASVKVVYYPKA